MSAKTLKRIHINRAEIKQIKRWQHNTKRRISRLESNKFAVVVFDEAPSRGEVKYHCDYHLRGKETIQALPLRTCKHSNDKYQHWHS